LLGDGRGELLGLIPSLLIDLLGGEALASLNTILEMKVLRKGAIVVGSCSLEKK
jgi:hypothetical protein